MSKWFYIKKHVQSNKFIKPLQFYSFIYFKNQKGPINSFFKFRNFFFLIYTLKCILLYSSILIYFIFYISFNKNIFFRAQWNLWIVFFHPKFHLNFSRFHFNGLTRFDKIKACLINWIQSLQSNHLIQIQWNILLHIYSIK